jgi:hypothetical protein
MNTPSTNLWLKLLITLFGAMYLTWAYIAHQADLWAVLLFYTVLGTYIERGYQYLKFKSVLHSHPMKREVSSE